MATAAEQTSIIELVVGMVGAAPGADILAELVDIIDAGVTMEELAVALQENPAYSGDMGLFPNYLPNAIYATQFVTNLLGDEVTEEVLEEAIDAMTAELNAGGHRGAVSYATVTALAASTDPDYADASQALANKVEVAEYYSVTLGVSSLDLDELIAVVSGVDSAEDAVADGEDAVDDAIAAAQPLLKLIDDLDAANSAIKTFLAAADGDSNAKTSLTEAQVDPGLLTTADGVVGPLLLEAGAAAAYAAGSDGVKDALIADELTANALDTKALATALAATLKAADAVTGLTSAHNVYLAAVDAAADATDATVITGANLTAEIAKYGVSDETVTPAGANTTFSTASDGVIIGLTTAGTSLEIKPGFTEATNPGITALFTAAITNFGAVFGTLASANKAVAAANLTVQNLDLGAGTKAAALKAISDAMVLRDAVVPALTDKASVLEIDVEQEGLQDALEALEDALDDIEHDGTTTAGGDAKVLAAVEAALDAAEAAGTITTAHNTAALAAFTDDATDDDDFAVAGALATEIAAVKAQLNTATGSLSAEFDVLVTAYEATLTTTPQSLVALVGGGAVANQSPLSLAVLDAIDAVEADADVNETLAEAIADRDAAIKAADDLEVLTDARDDAEDAFGDAGFGLPVTLGAVASGTSKDDVFLANDADSQILGFAEDDQLFLGDADLVLNADTTAGDEGDNDVLEYWITGTTSAVITVETSVFGSEAADPETFTITLTGVAAADVTVTDGILTIA